nr:hypothetical protein CTI12_AA330420 [Tanacetum cinerariifolium]
MMFYIGYTSLFQLDKPVTKAQAAVALASGEACDVVIEELACIDADSIAEKAIAAHTALVEQVEKDLNAKFEKDLLLEMEKITTVEKMAEDRELEIESKALSMARSWAEDEAKRTREQAKVLDEARDHWKSQGIKIVVDQDLREDANARATWFRDGDQLSLEGT